MENTIREFVACLASRPHTQNSCNPYREPSARNNLVRYLEKVYSQRGRPILLVGEALGYRGGLLTGIPFSSERLLRTAPHAFLRSLRDQLDIAGDTSEATATMVWGALAGRRKVPLFWNAFPFHPHRPGEPDSNRAPSGREVEESRLYLQQLARIFRPVKVAGLGRKGAQAAERALPGNKVTLLRHPSYGGKLEFEAGLERLLRT